MFSLDDVKKYLEDDGWNVWIEDDPEDPYIRTGINGNNDNYRISIMVFSKPAVVLIRMYDFVKINKMAIEKKGKLLELLNQHNAENLFGKVYMEENNELTYSYAVPLTDETVIDNIVFLKMLMLSVHFVDDMYPDVMKLIWS